MHKAVDRRRRTLSTGAKALVLALAGSALLAGCCPNNAPRRHRVEGLVRIDGEVIETGLITFIPLAPTKGPKVIGRIEHGRYVIEEGEGPCQGVLLVKIEAVPLAIEAIAAAKGLPGRTFGKGGSGRPRPVVAPQYNSDSKLQARVEPNGPNRFDFDVESAPVRRRPGGCPYMPSPPTELR